MSQLERLKVNEFPKRCNLCRGKVVLTSNARIYGRELGSGNIYLCTKCGAYVGTHKNDKERALGLLANEEMRQLKIQCHNLFDLKWKYLPDGNRLRGLAYRDLADKMGLERSSCHFGWFDRDHLIKALNILMEDKVVL